MDRHVFCGFLGFELDGHFVDNSLADIVACMVLLIKKKILFVFILRPAHILQNLSRLVMPLQKLVLLHLIVVEIIEGKPAEFVAQFLDSTLGFGRIGLVLHERGEHGAHILADSEVFLGKRELFLEQFVQLLQRVVLHHDYFVEVLNLLLQGMNAA